MSEFRRPDPAPLPDVDATTVGAEDSANSENAENAAHEDGTVNTAGATPNPQRTEEHSEQPADPREDARGEARERRGPVFGTIFWGALLLVIALLVGIHSVPAVTVDPTVLLIGAVVALGCLLVVAGVAAAVRGPNR